MSILAINIAPPLLRTLTLDDSLNVHSAKDVQQALDLIEARDFQIVIEDIRNDASLCDDLALLLAATPPGTLIYALVSNLWLPETEHWRSQGVKLLFEASSATVLQHLKAG